jgi:hypothetical protein
MAAVIEKRLLEHYKAEPQKAARELREAFRAGELKAEEFDFGRLFVECFGREEFDACKSGEQTTADVFGRHGSARLSEAQGAVSTAAFQNISGQIVYSAFLDRYKSEEFMFTTLIPEVKASFIDGEKMAGLTDVGDQMEVRNEGDPYVLAGVGENWVFTPPIRDRGLIVPVTWEAVFQDRTGRLLEYAGNLGWSAGLNKEKRAIDAVIDENTTAHRYNWRNAGQIATYGDNSGSHTWDNLEASNGLVDHTNIDAAEQLFNAMVDPFTGESIVVEPRHIIAVKALTLTANRILNSTQILTHLGGYPTSGNPQTAAQANPYLNRYTFVTSRLLASRLATDTDWFIGDVSVAVKYMYIERMNIVQAPALNHDDFHRRIVAQYRVNERGQHAVVEPRALLKSTA